MSFATLFHTPSLEEVYGREAAIAGLVSFGIAMIWLMIARLQKRPGARLVLSWPFWLFASSGIALLIVAIIAMLAAAPVEQQDRRVSRFLADKRPNKAPEPTPCAGTSAAVQPRVPAPVVAHL